MNLGEIIYYTPHLYKKIMYEFGGFNPNIKIAQLVKNSVYNYTDTVLYRNNINVTRVTKKITMNNKFLKLHYLFKTYRCVCPKCSNLNFHKKKIITHVHSYSECTDKNDIYYLRKSRFKNISKSYIF
jgi:hypothetical protein